MSVEFNKEYELGDFAYFSNEKISAEEVSQEEYISTENMVVDRGGVEKASKLPSVSKFNSFQKTDTLFSNIRTYFRKVWMASFDGGASADVLVFRTKDASVLDPAYLYYLISNKDFADYSVLTAKGVKMPRGDKTAMMQYKFLLPDPEKQLQYASALKSLDDKIENNRRMNETLEGMAQAIFKSWFVDFDPVHAKVEALKNGGSADDARIAAMCAISGQSPEALAQLKSENPNEYAQLATTADAFPSAFVDSDLGQIPEGWEVKGLDQIANYLNGLALQKFRPKDEDHFLPVLKIAQLKKGATDGAEKASPDIKPEYIVDNGDIVFSWSGSLVADVWCGGKAALNQHLFKVTSETHPKWLYYLYTRHHLQEFQRIAAAKAVTMGHIKREHLSRALCSIPPINGCLMEICERVLQQNLSKQIELRLECTSLAETRDALLPKLLSGEIDVSAVETSEGAA